MLRDVLYPALKLPVPIILWVHARIQKRKALRTLGKVDVHAPIILPVYTVVIIAYLVYVIANFLNQILDFNALTKKTWERVHATNFLQGLMYYLLGEGTLIFMLFFLFGFLASPTAGNYALRSSLYDAAKFFGVYGMIFLAAVCVPIDRRSYFQLKVAGCMIVIYFLFTIIVQIVRTKSHRWKQSLYVTVCAVMTVWIAYATLLCFAIISNHKPSYAIYISHSIILFYDLILPFLMYKCLIDDSRFWRNLEKYHIHTQLQHLHTTRVFHDFESVFFRLNRHLLNLCSLPFRVKSNEWVYLFLRH